MENPFKNIGSDMQVNPFKYYGGYDSPGKQFRKLLLTDPVLTYDDLQEALIEHLPQITTGDLKNAFEGKSTIGYALIDALTKITSLPLSYFQRIISMHTAYKAGYDEAMRDVKRA